MKQILLLLTATNLFLMWPVPQNALAQVTLTWLATFDVTNGQFPESALIQGRDGNFYGTTMAGGAYTNYGTVFQVTSSGLFRNLLSFNSTNGAFPEAGLMEDAQGNLCGTTYGGGDYGDGTVFRIGTNGAITSMSFDLAAGLEPNALLLQDTGGSYYGTTQFGGTNGYGSIFQLTPQDRVVTLASFTGTNGSYPYDSGLVTDENKNFYGCAASGGDGFDSTVIYSGWGSIFKLSNDGALTSLALFHGTNGAFPVGVLVRDLDGYFYGATCFGGIGFDGTATSGNGSVFKLASDGMLRTLAWFDNTNSGARPFAGITLATDGNLYGTTQEGGTNYPPRPNKGTVFPVTPEGTLTTLVSFDATNGYPMGGLLQGSDGDFYGTTAYGSIGNGGIFRLHVPGASAPKLRFAAQIGGQISFSWIPLRGRSYQLQYKTDIVLGSWIDLGVPILATNAPMTASKVDAVGDGQRFYRLLLVP